MVKGKIENLVAEGQRLKAEKHFDEKGNENMARYDISHDRASLVISTHDLSLDYPLLLLSPCVRSLVGGLKSMNIRFHAVKAINGNNHDCCCHWEHIHCRLHVFFFPPLLNRNQRSDQESGDSIQRLGSSDETPSRRIGQIRQNVFVLLRHR